MLKKTFRRLYRSLIFFRQYLLVLWQYQQLKKSCQSRFQLRWSDRWIHLRDATSSTGFDRHYVFHTAWAARKLAEIRPFHHVDIGSSLYFTCLVSAFVPMTFIDIRPASIDLANLALSSGSLLNLPYDEGSIDSLSCMHVVEHIGLGRYGDTFDPDGDLHAVSELKRVLSPGGQILFVVPVGGLARIQFNAHRIYSYNQVIAMFTGFQLREFALIPDDGSTEGLISHADPKLVDDQRYACGCFHFEKAA